MHSGMLAPLHVDSPYKWRLLTILGLKFSRACASGGPVPWADGGGRLDRLGEQVHPVASADFTLRIDRCSSCSVRIGVLQEHSKSARTGENWFHPDYVGRVQYCGGGLFSGNYREKSRHSGHTC